MLHDNLQSVMKNTTSQITESQQVSGKINIKKTTLRPIIIQLLKCKHKKNMKKTEKIEALHMEETMQIMTDFSL